MSVLIVVSNSDSAFSSNSFAQKEGKFLAKQNNYVHKNNLNSEVIIVEQKDLIFLFIFVLLCFVLLLVVMTIMRNPFQFPYMTIYIDISGKRNVKAEDYIDRYLINNKFDFIKLHEEKIKKWKKDCNYTIRSSMLEEYRQKQYNKILDEGKTYQFIFQRLQTRYYQRNYTKTAYKIMNEDKMFCCSYDYLLDRYRKLSMIELACPLSEYESKNQRKLMTKELRRQIMIRDDYTCQICGKYMPDEVGLQIDHIIPVSKGGKTIPSNLQTLCSKCNGKKANKL